MILLDTHVLIWFKAGDKKLKPKDIKNILKAHKEGTLFLSAISIWEIAMLHKKKRLALNQPLEKWLQDVTRGLKVLPIDSDIARESVLLPDCDHNDPADRFIIATARVFKLTIITYDKVILDYIKQGHITA